MVFGLARLERVRWKVKALCFALIRKPRESAIILWSPSFVSTPVIHLTYCRLANNMWLGYSAVLGIRVTDSIAGIETGWQLQSPPRKSFDRSGICVDTSLKQYLTSR